jgi:hypothetical protein
MQKLEGWLIKINLMFLECLYLKIDIEFRFFPYNNLNQKVFLILRWDEVTILIVKKILWSILWNIHF